MINILIIFLTQYFEGKNDLMIKISPLQTKGLLFNLLIFFLSMNETNEKKPLGDFFNLNALERKGLSLGRKQNGSFNHVPLGRKGTTSQSEKD
jgi:hypothetical protein